MKLPNAPAKYDTANESQTRKALETADAANFKSGQDIQLLRGEKLVKKAESGGNKYQVIILDGGRMCTQQVS